MLPPNEPERVTFDLDPNEALVPLDFFWRMDNPSTKAISQPDVRPGTSRHGQGRRTNVIAICEGRPERGGCLAAP